jgi:diguanylate cyclase (GGDEF)-like protein
MTELGAASASDSIFRRGSWHRTCFFRAPEYVPSMSQFLKAAWARLAREQTVLVTLVVVYVISGRLGLLLAFEHPATTVVWPPAGIALGAFLVLGYRVWPVILAASTLVLATTIGPMPGILAISTGSTLESLLCAYLVNRFAGGRSALHGPENTVRLAGLIVLSSLSVSATCSAVTLGLTGLIAWSDYGSVWLQWSVGQMTSAIIVTPAILLWTARTTSRWRPSRTIEAGVVLLAVFFVGLLVFCGFPAIVRGYPLEFLCVPVLLWAAFRLGRRTTAIAVLILAALAIAGTLNSFGPFQRSTPTTSLMLVQAFISLMAVMTLALAALAAEYAVAEAQLRELVVTDPLTGLPNYRRLLDVLSAEISRSNRSNTPFSVVFFDMDGLKRINDELGHLIGSRAVCRFAETLKASCRGTDTAARYGGDEFVVILPDTDDDGAETIIQRVQERLAEDPDKPELAVSAGVAVYPRDGGTPTTLLSAADRALYVAKAGKSTDKRPGVVAISEWTNVR